MDREVFKTNRTYPFSFNDNELNMCNECQKKKKHIYVIIKLQM